jgi:hypothetical protein
MGAVLEVRSRRTGVSYAAKTILEPGDSQARARFAREAELLGRCDRHPGIVKVHSTGELPDGTPYMILDLVPGESLAALLAREEKLEPRRAAELALRLARALAFVHERGIVHRDVKPSNVLLDQASGEPRLTDFGIAAARDLERLTRTGVFVGTLSYCAPEQVFGGEVGPPADVFALGCVLHELLAGAPPIQGEGPQDVLARLASDGSLPDVRTIVPEVPAPLAGIVGRCIEKDARRRYHDGAELARELEAFLEGRKVRGRAARPARFIAAAGALAALALGLLLFERHERARVEATEPREVAVVSTERARSVSVSEASEVEGDAFSEKKDFARAVESYGRAGPRARTKRAIAAARAGMDAVALEDPGALPDPAKLPADRAALAPLAAPLYRRGLAAKDPDAGERDLDLAWRLAPPPPDLVERVVTCSRDWASNKLQDLLTGGPKARELQLGRVRAVAALHRVHDLAPGQGDFWDELAFVRRRTEDMESRELRERVSAELYAEWPEHPLVLLLRARTIWLAQPREALGLLRRAIVALPAPGPAVKQHIETMLETLGWIVGWADFTEEDVRPFESVARDFGELAFHYYESALATARESPDPNVVEAERMKVVSCSSGTAGPRGGLGSASRVLVLYWSGASRGAKLVLAFDSPRAGKHRVTFRFSSAKDYGIARVTLGDRSLGEIDFYAPSHAWLERTLDVDLIPTGNTITVELLGANRAASQGMVFALDYVKVED